MMRILITLLVVAIVIIAAMALMANSLKRSSMFYPDRFPAGLWNTEHLPVQPLDVQFRAADGVLIHAWHFRSAKAEAPLLIWFHGNAGNLTDRASVAAQYATLGLSVLVFDYRGYGKSEGSPTEKGLYLDSLAAWDHAVSELKVPPHRIALYGESLGGPYAAHVASERRGACCVVIENSFPSAAAIARSIPIYRPFSPFLAGSLRTTEYLNRSSIPVLVMHGRRDTVIPYALGVELFDGISGQKQFFTSDDAAHAEIPSVEGERYFRTVLSFIREHGGLRDDG